MYAPLQMNLSKIEKGRDLTQSNDKHPYMTDSS